MGNLRFGKLIPGLTRLGASLPAIVLLAALFVLCAPPAFGQTDGGPQPRLQIGSINENWLGSFWKPPAGREKEFETESRASKLYPGKIVRWSNLLALKLENANFVWLVDMGNDPDTGGFGFYCCAIYRLMDYWSDVGYYIVDINQGETGGALIISDKTADFIKVSWPPRRDPVTPGLFITVPTGDFGPGTAEVWELKKTGWRQVYKCQNIVYGTEFSGWEGPRRALLSITAQDGSVRKAVLAEDNGVWHTDACEKNE
jgi:hypothetical protein